MIIVGGGGISPRGLDLPKLPPLWDDKWLPGLRKLVDAVHRYDGIKIGMQLLHGGRQQSRPTREGRQAPSPIPALAVVSGDGLIKERDIKKKFMILQKKGENYEKC